MKKTTLTIGVPAFNEELNIETFLRSLFDQTLENIDLKEVLVYSDASSDKTDTIIQKLSKTFPMIRLIRGKSRKGKYFRVNELFKINTSDVLIILDADIALARKNFFETMVTTLISDKKAVMLAGHVELIRPSGFVAKIIHTSFVLGDFMRLSVPGYDIAENFHGAATAYKKDFLKNIHIPTNLSDPHLYIYLSAKKINGFRYSEEAIILQNPPTTMKDVNQLMQRSIGKKDSELEKIFGKEMIEQVHIIPRSAKIKGVFKCFLWQPFYTPLALFIAFYLGRIARPEKVDASPIWEINTSTKKQITYEH
jgi:glycosyltransferase involved in cell wall biosynthesis